MSGLRGSWKKRPSGCGCGLAILAVLFAGTLVALYYMDRLPFFRRETGGPPPSGEELSVNVLDVGQGDAIVIRVTNGKTVLIDAGDNGKGKIILEYLKRAEITKLDYVFVTHAHPDHLGGAAEIVKAVPVGVAITSGVNVTKVEDSAGKKKGGARPPKGKLPQGAQEQFLAAVAERGVAREEAKPGAVYDLGGGVRLQVLAPTEPLFTSEDMRHGGNVPNANSMVLRLEYGDFSMLLAGDAEAQTEQRLMAGNLSAASILKVSHHGSDYATSEPFIERVAPQAALLSVGENNRYGHPSQAVLDRLKAKKISIYRTDLQGDISIVTTGKGFTIKTAREGTTKDLLTGRKKEKDDSTRSGFLAYGDFGPAPKPKPTPAKPAR